MGGRLPTALRRRPGRVGGWVRAQDGPAPGEELNPGPETVPRQAASVIVLRGGADALEVLLVKRTPNASFMGGVWVFPGGSVDATDAADGDAADHGDGAATDRGHRRLRCASCAKRQAST